MTRGFIHQGSLIITEVNLLADVLRPPGTSAWRLIFTFNYESR